MVRRKLSNKPQAKFRFGRGGLMSLVSRSRRGRHGPGWKRHQLSSHDHGNNKSGQKRGIEKKRWRNDQR